MAKNLTMPVADGLTQYLNMIGQYPIMPKHEIYYNFEKYNETNDNKYIQKIILHHLKYVVYISKKYINYGLPLYDLIQEGNIGLMHGIKKFDYIKAKENNTGLMTFVVHDIKHKIYEYVIANIGLIHCITTKDHRKIFFNRKKFNSYPRPLTDEVINQITKDMNLKFSKSVREMEDRLHLKIIPIHVDDDDNDSFNNLDATMISNKSDDPLDIMLNEEKRNTRVTNLLKDKLTDREYDILNSRWLSDKKSTLHELSLVYNVSKERIRQIEKNAINKIGKLNEKSN